MHNKDKGLGYGIFEFFINIFQYFMFYHLQFNIDLKNITGTKPDSTKFNNQ
jgi:hypothetical protein